MQAKVRRGLDLLKGSSVFCTDNQDDDGHHEKKHNYYNDNLGTSWWFPSFKPATRMLLIYAYQFIPVQEPGFTGWKVTSVGPLS